MSGAWGAPAPERAAMKELPLIKEVHMDGLAVLKIIKHCTEALPGMVAGSLLGLDQSATLEVTHSFPLPSAKKEADTGGEGGVGLARPADELSNLSGQDYQMEMMKMLREVNVDNNCVGWYQSMYLGSFCTQTLVDNQYTYQENLSDNAVVVLYDPVQTARGQLTLKAYRLSKEFMRAYRERKSDHIKPSEILDELPIRIRNPGLVNALVYDLQGRGGAGSAECDFERLDLSTNPYLEKNLEFLCGWVDDLANEQWKFQAYTRTLLKQRHDAARWADRRKKANDERRAAGDEPLPDDEAHDRRPDAPNRMESLLISTQISAYCSQINRFTGSSFEKLFLAGSLQREAT
ncbi:eukaryotic initiation factor 3H1 subunit [Tribonema minus]|uniref:Eukaryotic translation initiation factor 3 subunit H n=1 Tax=Tribonema minus TaxID=303371 RepID=A0A836CJJ9_9STRA|nr:eukaryotic initiation factor 3H1 subunit [Tribonema minus]